MKMMKNSDNPEVLNTLSDLPGGKELIRYIEGQG
jgi:hypothetical protein